MRQAELRRIVASTLVCGGLSLAGGASAAPLALPDMPLGISTYIDPNVMLLIDNSGSMNNIIWDSGYDHSVVYDPVYIYNSATGLWDLQVQSTATYILRDTAEIYASIDGKYKKLKLPEVVRRVDATVEGTLYYGNYLNYLFNTYPHEADLTNGQIPLDYRMNVARNATTNLVKATPGMRFGVASFNQTHGGQINAACGSEQSAVESAIARLTGSTATPLAESYYEITRYFRGLSSFYNDGTYASPIQYRCQKNFAVVITDGLPTYDTTFPKPSEDPDLDNGCGDTANKPPCLPNWDKLAPTTTADMAPNFPAFSDGFGGSEHVEGSTLYLDDLAKFGYDIDMRNTTALDLAGHSFNSPDFLVQNLRTYTIGYTHSNQMLEDAAHYGKGLYLRADDAEQLTQALRGAMVDIQGKTSSASAIAANTGFVSGETLLYQGRFNSADWSGQLLAFEIDPVTGKLKPVDSDVKIPKWDAAQLIPGPASRTIVTHDGTKGVPFQWNSLTTAQQTLLNNANILNYLRGDASKEQRNGGTLRNRASKLGTLINSSPAYVGSPIFRYPDNWGSGAPESGGNSKYSDFKRNYSTRGTTNPMVYVGGNDGMLHGFDGATGVEKLAHVPNSVYRNLAAYASPTHTHKYYVDGSPSVVDAFVGSRWRTVLVGGLNKGGQGVYALDVTDPAAFSESGAHNIVLWEFSDKDDPDLGYTFSRPAIVRMKNGKWAAVFGNGYNNTEADGSASTTGHASLFIVFLDGPGTGGKWNLGTHYVKLSTQVGSPDRPNGLATVAPVDVDGDYIVDFIYAGDLEGNLWKFDVNNTNAGQWGVAFSSGNTPAPLFVATDSAGNRQPITVRPEVGVIRDGSHNTMVYFGTGKYLELSDNSASGTGTQSFYGIRDKGSRIANRSGFLEQTVESFEHTFTNDKGESYTQRVRTVSKNGDDKFQNWFMDLPDPGERAVSDPFLRGSARPRIIFPTIVPSDDPCKFGGTTWLMELDARDGSRTHEPVFDLNYDGQFDFSDNVGNTEVINGWAREGVMQSPSVIAAGDKEFKYMSSSTGAVEQVTESPAPGTYGRQSWRQLK